MKIWISGASGFLGYHVASYFHGQADFTVTAAGRKEEGLKRLAAQEIKTAQGDLLDLAFLRNSIEAQSVLIHCAALSSPWGSFDDFYQANVMASENLARVALEKNCALFVHISTPSIYFQYKNQFNLKEDQVAPKRVNFYAETKFLGEEKLREFGRLGLPFIILRPRAIYGPYDTSLITRLLKVYRKLGSMPIFTKDALWMDVSYVENVVAAILACLKAPPAALGEAYNVSDQEPVHFQEFIRKLFLGLGLGETQFKYVDMNLALNLARILEWVYPYQFEPPLTRYSAGLLAYSQTLDSNKAQKQLGYKAAISSDQGLEKTVKFLKEPI